jgi:lipoic acid synthetase
MYTEDPVMRWVKPEEFVELAEEAREMGFGVMSGPLVRSSYRAGRLYNEALQRRSLALMSGPR